VAQSSADRRRGFDLQGEPVSAARKPFIRSQDGYTLIEVVIASALGAMLMGALFSVIFTSWQAVKTATSRVEASQQIRSFQFFAYDDFARSPLPAPNGCVGAPPTNCTISLAGVQASNSAPPVTAPYPMSYTWDVQTGFLDRNVGSNPPIHVATNVTAFSYYIDGTAPNQTVVVSLTVTVQSYSESQALRFYPQVNP
jgi:prepilin-type N-terminal cleavage/methylation domain-containing protein